MTRPKESTVGKMVTRLNKKPHLVPLPIPTQYVVDPEDPSAKAYAWKNLSTGRTLTLVGEEPNPVSANAVANSQEVTTKRRGWKPEQSQQSAPTN